MDTGSHTHMQTWASTYTHRDTDTASHLHTHTDHRLTYTCTQTQAHTYLHTHTHTHTLGTYTPLGIKMGDDSRETSHCLSGHTPLTGRKQPRKHVLGHPSLQGVNRRTGAEGRTLHDSPRCRYAAESASLSPAGRGFLVAHW